MIVARLKHLGISPRKVRLVADLIRGLPVEEAQNQLKFLNKRASQPLLKLLNSAIANAQHNFGLDKSSLLIDKITVDAGPSLKRWRARAMGRAARIIKRSCQITLVLKPEEAIAPQALRAKAATPKPEEEAKPKDVLLKKEETREEIVKKPEPVARPKPQPPQKPYGATPQAKKRFFSRQTFGNVKKFFRRKSI